jgi:hypothetical protein
VAIISGIDEECPLALWNTFVVDAELTLNSLRESPSQPGISTWERLNGPLDLNATPIAPLGTRIVAHVPADKRASWGNHGEPGFYTGRAPLHYRSFNVWIQRTRSFRITDCVAWFPNKLQFPIHSPSDLLTAAIRDIEPVLADASTREIEALNVLTEYAQQLQLHPPPVATQFRDQQRVHESLPPSSTLTSAVQPGSTTSAAAQPGSTLVYPAQPSYPLSPPAQQVSAKQRVPTATSAPLPKPSANPTATAALPTATVPKPLLISKQRSCSPQAATIPQHVLSDLASPPEATLEVFTDSANVNPPVPATASLLLPSSRNRVVIPTAKRRNIHRYYTLSPAEINNLPKPVFKRIGMTFTDHSDRADELDGIVDAVVKHAKSRKLFFRYWNHLVDDEKPTSPADFEYLLVSYAMTNCKWSKTKSQVKKNQSFFASSAQIITAEQNLFNYGRASVSRSKQRRQRQRPRLEWYQKLAKPESPTLSSSFSLGALSAIDLNADGTRLTSTSALNGPDREEWLIKFGEEIVRLVTSGTGTFIRRSEVPVGKSVAYCNPQLKIKMKDGKLVKRVRSTIGGDQLPYQGPTAAQTAALEVIRLLLNCTVSERAMLMTLDIKDFYLGTPLDEAEFMRIPLKFIPIDVQLKYNIKAVQTHDAVIMRINKSIYGLKQSGILSQQRLVKHLAKHGYQQCHFTPCLFIHDTNGTAFTLVVDDFLVKYKDTTAAQHLISALQELYEITVDTAPIQKYVGITIDYKPDKQYIDLSMPGYVKKALVRFGKTAVRGVNSPMTYIPPNYGAKTQTLKPDAVASTPLNPAQVLFVQEVVGVFLYYSRAVDLLMITAINKIGSRQAGADVTILGDIERFLQYASRWDSNVMRIHGSNMILNVHSDASYLSETKARSRAGAFMCMGTDMHGTRPNAPVLYLSVIISTIVDSATAAEYAAAFIAAQAATSLRITLGELGYPQPATQITCDNACAVGIANDSFSQKRSKTIDMRYHWLRDQVRLGNFTIIWQPGSINLADFFTKAHSVEHHLNMIKTYSVAEEGVLSNVHTHTTN